MKKLIYFVFTILIIVGILSYPREKTNKIRVAEVTHSVFYTPFYVALENGYFKEEGLNIELILTPGADKVTAAVLSNDSSLCFIPCEGAVIPIKSSFFKNFGYIIFPCMIYIVSYKRDFVSNTD